MARRQQPEVDGHPHRGRFLPLRNVHSGLCADVRDNSKEAGAAVIQWPCSGAANQRWAATWKNGGYTLTSKSSGLLLTMASGADGALISQRPAASGAIQTWSFVPQS
ncbi:RICIN domain-containing protein [Streptomyces althioticus]|uniref:RICIN domain-containing protein n=1 Tax=Streptomyces althioticus TaxID=83380 RepID=UPI0037BA93C7